MIHLLRISEITANEWRTSADSDNEVDWLLKPVKKVTLSLYFGITIALSVVGSERTRAELVVCRLPLVFVVCSWIDLQFWNGSCSRVHLSPFQVYHCPRHSGSVLLLSIWLNALQWECSGKVNPCHISTLELKTPIRWVIVVGDGSHSKEENHKVEK